MASEMRMQGARVGRWLEPSLWLLILIRTGSVVLLPSTVTRIPLVLVLLRPTGEVLLISAATARGVRLLTIAVLAVLSRVVLNLAMFVLLTKYAPALVSRFLPERQTQNGGLAAIEGDKAGSSRYLYVPPNQNCRRCLRAGRPQAWQIYGERSRRQYLGRLRVPGHRPTLHG